LSRDIVRRDWLQMCAEEIRWAKANKVSQDSLLAIASRYRLLPAPDRVVVDELVAEQVLSKDVSVRFVAQSLIYDFFIEQAQPELAQLVIRLESERTPDAPYELASVRRLIDRLDSVPESDKSGEGWTRQELIEYENDPAHLQIASPSSNRSHKYEGPQ